MKKIQDEKFLFVACGALREELSGIVYKMYPRARIFFTDPLLDLSPKRLEETLRGFIDAHADANKIILAFGRCTPNIDSIVDCRRVFRLKGGSCYEMLLGEKFLTLMQRERGYFFLTPFLCRNFWTAAKHLGLDSPLLKESLFRNYQKIVLIDTGERGLKKKAEGVSKWMQLPLRVEKINLKNLKKNVEETVKGIQT